MKQLSRALVIASGLLSLVPGFAAAQSQNCAKRERVVERLAEQYGETRQAIGIGSSDAVMEVFASEDTGTWTITVTFPTGITCLIASGEAYETLSETLPTSSSDA